MGHSLELLGGRNRAISARYRGLDSSVSDQISVSLEGPRDHLQEAIPSVKKGTDFVNIVPQLKKWFDSYWCTSLLLYLSLKSRKKSVKLVLVNPLCFCYIFRCALHVDTREEVWSHVPLVVTSDMSASLLRPFTDIELRAAVAALDASSCPGDDGLTRQFFLEYWELLHRPLLLGLQQMFDTGSMPPSMTSGLIALIPKGGTLLCYVSGDRLPYSPLLTNSWLI